MGPLTETSTKEREEKKRGTKVSSDHWQEYSSQLWPSLHLPWPSAPSAWTWPWPCLGRLLGHGAWRQWTEHRALASRHLPTYGEAPHAGAPYSGWR